MSTLEIVSNLKDEKEKEPLLRGNLGVEVFWDRESAASDVKQFKENVEEQFIEIKKDLKVNVRYCRFINHPIRLDELDLKNEKDEPAYISDDYPAIRERGAGPSRAEIVTASDKNR